MAKMSAKGAMVVEPLVMFERFALLNCALPVKGGLPMEGKMRLPSMRS